MTRDFVEVLAVGAHPDDIELGCGGLLILLRRRGYRFAMVDLTAGEMGSRGDRETRAGEAKAAAALLQASGRECLGLPDTKLEATAGAVRLFAEAVRRWRPRLVLTMDGGDVHPDHVACARIAERGVFFAALKNYEAEGDPHRIHKLVRYSRRAGFSPSFVVDISDVYEEKRSAVRCYASQFTRSGGGAKTPISAPEFEADLEALWRYHGQQIGALYAEPYRIDGPPALADPVAELCIRRRDVD